MQDDVIIAGKTVTIENSASIVRLSHPAGTKVFTGTANFNKTGFGNFTDKDGAVVPSPHAGGFDNATPPY